MPLGLSAHPHRHTRPGSRPAPRRPAACLSTRKRAATKTPGPARPFSASPARRRPNSSSTANRWWEQNQDRRAVSATTNAPAGGCINASRQWLPQSRPNGREQAGAPRLEELRTTLSDLLAHRQGQPVRQRP